MKSTIFWNIRECSPLKFDPRFGGTYRLHLQGKKPAAYSSTLKMEAICSSETSADFKRTTRRYIAEDTTLQTPSSFGISNKELRTVDNG
jgi:hypothetical protein